MSGKYHVKAKNAKEAVTIMLNWGSKVFAPGIIHTFAHMSNYNDLTPAQLNSSGSNL